MIEHAEKSDKKQEQTLDAFRIAVKTSRKHSENLQAGCKQALRDIGFDSQEVEITLNECNSMKWSLEPFVCTVAAYIININKLLLKHSEQLNVNKWLVSSNEYLDGRTAKEMMLSGHTGIASVHRILKKYEVCGNG